MADRIWISWNEQRRNIGLAAAVNAHLYMTDWKLPGWRRIPKEFYESWKIIHKEKPSVCFTMNPSIFSSWWLSILSRAYKYHLVTDLHTPNIKLSGIKKILFHFFFDSGIRRSDIIIVTNDIYYQAVLSLNRNVVIIPDPLPALKKPFRQTVNDHQSAENKMKIILVSSFGDDEPINEVLELDPEIDEFDIMVTGNWKKKFQIPPVTRNIRFLGFLPDAEYDRHLLSADGVMVLTQSEGCLCCGAYEAFAAGKPIILSHTKALQGFFGEAPVYTQNSSASILSALRKLKDEKEERAKLVIKERDMLNSKFKKGIADLEKAIAGIG